MLKLRPWFEWAEAHPKIWLDLVRIYLGIGLFVRGVMMFTSSRADFISELIQRSGESWLFTAAVLHYVAIAHFVGGILLVTGLLTRIAAGAQLPILAGAVFLIHGSEGLMAPGQSLEFSALVLFLLAIITVAGAGPLSVDGEKSAAQSGAATRRSAAG